MRFTIQELGNPIKENQNRAKEFNIHEDTINTRSAGHKNLTKTQAGGSAAKREVIQIKVQMKISHAAKGKHANS